MFLTIDIEVTNRCNATCHFCPRDATPHQGIMDVETFDRSLSRAVDYRKVVDDVSALPVTISLCGLGEPLINKNTISYVKKVKAEGFQCSMSSNGNLLTEDVSRELLAAGLDEIYINISDIDDEYERIYNLPFERSCENITRFAQLAKEAGGHCTPVIILVDHRDDQEHVKAMEAFWRERGLANFHDYSVINRGGALFVEHMQFEEYTEMVKARQELTEGGAQPLCGAPWGFLFIGYDGNYYLCCSDWRKQASLGSVFDHSFLQVTRQKLEMVVSRDPVCKTCNHDPINLLTEELRAQAVGDVTEEEVDVLRQSLLQGSREIEVALGRLLDYGDKHPDGMLPVNMIPVVAAS
ncbi:MAG: MoaA/NifB/PqqE/SkfB family radical SAM enzyme [Halioglobus sp.]|jgi:MoaA/NifB/PqqE/SkfB family radical SAM enzyme